MTMPSLIQKHKKIETASRLKKVYSTMQQAVLMSKANNVWELQNNPLSDRYNNEKLAEWFNITLAPYMNIAKNCGTAQNMGCVGYLDNTSFVKVVLADGSSFIMNNNGNIHMIVDVNGKKKPNQLGRDLFIFFLNPENGSFVPSNYICIINPEGVCFDTYATTREDLKKLCGAEGGSHTPDTNSCAALIMYDGWEIKEDYPLRL